MLTNEELFDKYQNWLTTTSPIKVYLYNQAYFDGYRQAEKDIKEELRLIKQCYDFCQGKCDRTCKWEWCVLKQA